MGSDKKVAILGDHTSFSSGAWDAYIKMKPGRESLMQVYCAKIENCIKSVYDGTADRTIVPILNSTRDAAWVAETLNGLKNYDMQICGEVELPIEHYLVVLPYSTDDSSGIKEVRSKDKALEQCMHNLEEHFPLAKQISMDSTSDAAKYLLESGDTSCAAIIPKSAAEKYESEDKLKIRYPDLQDEANNRTRFIVLGKESPEPTGNDKTTIIFRFENMGESGLLNNLLGELANREISLAYLQTVPNDVKSDLLVNKNETYEGTQLEFEFSEAKKPGLLYDALSIIAGKNINMSYTQSIPNGDLNNVNFICDLDTGAESEDIKDVVGELNGLDNIGQCEAKPLTERLPKELTFYMEILGHREDALLSEAIDAILDSNDFDLWKVCGSYQIYPKH